MTKGVIVLAGKKKDVLQVRFVTEKGNPITKAVPVSEISPRLQHMMNDAKERAKLEGQEVVLDVVKGEPRNVRFADEQVPARQGGAPPHKAQTSGTAGSRGAAQGSARSTQAAGAAQGQSVGRAAGHFHNPYNFVPAPPRNVRDSNLGDHAPPGHHRMEDDRYSGVLRVRMVCGSPLLVVDAAAAEPWQDDPEHKVYPVRLGVDGKPYVAPTSVKGMLRAAYEAVTNSRFAVFEGWGRRLAMRRPARVDVVPVRILAASSDFLEIAVLKELWLKAPAKLPRYARHANGDRRKGENKAALRYSDGTLPEHMDHVCVRVNPKGYVTSICKWPMNANVQGWYEGWVYITNANIGNKRNERVFVVSKADTVIRLEGHEARRVLRLWGDLIADYQDIHKKDLEARRQKGQRPDDYLGDEPGKTAWSRHVYTRNAVELDAWCLCYARLDNATNVVNGLYPVGISRELHKVSPLSLLPESLRPATRIDQLSPADRVFGWVNQEGAGAWRGLLRVGPVECCTPDPVEHFAAPGLPLAILGQPKPAQARFYVAANTNGEAQKAGLAKEQAGYAEGKGLRGRKVYPHHRGLPASHWQQATEDRTQRAVNGHYQEYRRPRLDGKEQRDSQNRSILGWVKPAVEFQFDLHVMNLSQVELGALVWLLTLPEGHFHRLGGGKPLGFGSVRLELVADKTRVAVGKAWKEFYQRLDAQAPSDAALDEARAAFEKSVAACYAKGTAFMEVRFIKAFLRAARGFDGGLPVHYPRVADPNNPHSVPPNPGGEGYEWFVANERTSDGKCLGWPLPDLADGEPLPVLNKGGDHGQRGQGRQGGKGGRGSGGGKPKGGSQHRRS